MTVPRLTRAVGRMVLVRGRAVREDMAGTFCADRIRDLSSGRPTDDRQRQSERQEAPEHLP